MRSRLFRLLFVAHFFLPYIGSSRLRVDVVVGYLCVALLPFRIRLKELTSIERLALSAALACALWSGARIALVDEAFTERVVQFTYCTFPITALATFIVLRPWLGTMEQLVTDLIPMSILVNLVAFEQARDPASGLNEQVFSLYGGYNITTYSVGSLAEFEVKYAGRCTGIFNGMHVLALFDVMILVLVLATLSGPRPSRIRQLLNALAGIAAFIGGVLASSKSFYYGAAVATLAMLLLRQIPGSIWLAIWTGLGGLALRQVLSASSFADITVDYFESVRAPSFDSTLGSRFGHGGFLRSTIDTILDKPLILLVGSSFEEPGLTMADNAYLGLIVVGGIPLLILFYASVLLPAFDALRRVMAGERRLAPIVAMTAAFLAIGIGIPSLQTGRIAPLFYLLMFVGLWGQAPERRAERGPAPGTIRRARHTLRASP